MYLDAGTKRAILNDPLYLGMRKTRPGDRGPLFFCRRICRSSAGVFPNWCIHFEDWTARTPCIFSSAIATSTRLNDDVQGRQGITLAGDQPAKIKGKN